MTTSDTNPSTFERFLRAYRAGGLADELSRAVADVAAACRETGKKGTVTLTITLDPHGRTITVSDDVKAKAPNPPKLSEIFYPDDSGHLHKEDPAQLRLQLVQDADVKVSTSATTTPPATSTPPPARSRRSDP
jgi:hypothetical protein